MVFNLVHIYGASMIEADIDGLYDKHYFEWIMSSIGSLKFISLYLGYLEISKDQ